MVSTLLILADLFLIACQGFFQKTKTSRTIFDSVVLDQSSASGFVSKTLLAIGGTAPINLGHIFLREREILGRLQDSFSGVHCNIFIWNKNSKRRKEFFRF